MTVKELIERLGREPLDAEVLVGQDSERMRRVYAVKFAWARQTGSIWKEQLDKTDNQTKTAVVIWA